MRQEKSTLGCRRLVAGTARGVEVLDDHSTEYLEGLRNVSFSA